LDKKTLHDLLGSSSLEIESEDELLKTLIELGSDYFEFWPYLEVAFLSETGISLFVENLHFDELTPDIWCKVVSRLRGVSDDELRSQRLHFATHSATDSATHIATHSVIVPDFPEILNEIRGNGWTLLYRGTEHGFGSSDFHSKCDGKANTITIILTTKGFIFGGFTPVAWDSSNDYKADISQKSFVFSLKNPHKSEAKKFSISNLSYAIYCNSSAGPTFGRGFDIAVANNCNGNTNSYTSLGNAYVNDTGIAATKVFTGEQSFQVKEIEVFEISL
jgi:hypothetical protein